MNVSAESENKTSADQEKIDNLSEIQKRAQALARTIGEDQTMEVAIGPRNGRTYWNWKDNKVVIDEKDAERRIEEALGAISHEGMHRKISRVSMIPKEILQDPGFNALMQTMEDVRVNTALEQMYPGAGAWIKETMKAILHEGGGTKNIAEINNEVQKNLGYIPYQFEFCEQIQSRWTFGEYSNDVSQTVKLALKKVQDSIDLVRTNIPPINANEEEKSKYAQNGYITLRTKIWPVYEELVVLDKENETLRQFILDLVSDDTNSAMDILIEKINVEELDELTNLLDEVKTQVNASNISTIANLDSDSTFNLADFREMSPSLRSKMLETIKEKNQKQKNENPQTEEQKRAEEILKAIEDMIVEELRPKMVDPKNYETHAEFEMNNEEKQKYEDEIKKIRLEEQIKAESMKGDYQKSYEEVAPLIEELTFELEEILYPNKASRWKPGYPTGSRVSLAKAMQFEADPKQYKNLFERKTLADIRDYRFTLLVDLSGSMRNDDRNIEALKATILFAEVLDRIGINFEILGFNTLPRREADREDYVFKDYSTPYDKESKVRTQRIVSDTYEYNADATDAGPALMWASDRLDKQDAQKKFVFVITDGEPAYSQHYGDEHSAPYGIDFIVNKVMKKDQYLVGLGIGEGTQSVKMHYPNNRVVPNVHSLAPEIGEIIKDIIENPEKYQL